MPTTICGTDLLNKKVSGPSTLVTFLRDGPLRQAVESHTLLSVETSVEKSYLGPLKHPKSWTVSHIIFGCRPKIWIIWRSKFKLQMHISKIWIFRKIQVQTLIGCRSSSDPPQVPNPPQVPDRPQVPDPLVNKELGLKGSHLSWFLGPNSAMLK